MHTFSNTFKNTLKRLKKTAVGYMSTLQPSPFDIGILMFILVLGIIPVQLFESSYHPEVSTLHYLYSTIFQGLAALLGLLLIVLTLGYQLIRSNAQKLEAEVASDFFDLVRKEYIDEKQARNDLGEWRRNEYQSDVDCYVGDLRLKKLEQDSRTLPVVRLNLATVRLLQGPLGILGGRAKSYDDLRSMDKSYRQLARKLARFEEETGRYERLPRLALTCMLPFVFSLFNSLLSLAMVSNSETYLDHAARPAIFAVYAAAVSILYTLLYFVAVFGQLSAKSAQKTLVEIGLPTQPDLDESIKTVLKESDDKASTPLTEVH